MIEQTVCPFKEGDLVYYMDENGCNSYESKPILKAIFIRTKIAFSRSDIAIISVIGDNNGHDGRELYSSETEEFERKYGCGRTSYWNVPVKNLHFFRFEFNVKGDIMEIKHNAKIERRVDLLNDSRVLSLEIDEEARKLFSQFACQGEELVTNDNGFKRYRIKSVLSSIV
jgi:hypothetical protein